jgi:hypothetical protein
MTVYIEYLSFCSPSRLTLTAMPDGTYRGQVNGTGITPSIRTAPGSFGPHTELFHQPTIPSLINGGITQSAQATDIIDGTVVDRIGFGGYTEDNNPVVGIDANNTVHVHYALDKTLKFKEWHLPKEFPVVMFRDYPAQSMPHPNGIPRGMKSVCWVNWWLKKGEGRKLFGRCRNAHELIKLFNLMGVRTSAAYDESSAQAQSDENIGLTTYKRTRISNFWAAKERYSSVIVTNHVQRMDCLWWLLVRVREENQYEDTNPVKDVQSLYYWRWEPFRCDSREMPPWFEYNSEDPTGVSDYTGYPKKWGFVLQQLDRFGGNPLDRERACRALYPEEDDDSYIMEAKQLPNLELYVKC